MECDEAMGLINSAVHFGRHAFGSLGAGWMMDRIGVRLGFCSLALIVWSLAAAAACPWPRETRSSLGIVRFQAGPRRGW